MRRIRRYRGLALALVVALATGRCDSASGTPRQAPPSLSDSAFAALSARLSEPGGYFDTDNLISNEDSYLHAVSQLRQLRAEGGTYVGVGPDQNFSYIAAVRPNVAFIVDIRHDNLLEQLLFKSIFALARNRAEYLALLFGRVAPPDTAGWSAASVDSLLSYIEGARRDSTGRGRVMARVRASRLRLPAADVATVARFHDAFVTAGPALRFNSFGRAPQPYYPDFRQLARERDREGNPASFLASEAAFRRVKDLEDRNLVIPVVGDFAGTHALAAIADWMKAHDERLTAFYTSNVEQYLFRDGGFRAFAASVARMPRAP
ncbi:MAG TPA: hypothetical protein VG916_07190, partial [Gemmatimonadaceae bacterium]|nr:hypothetical protein [Gemmatimonadaceae bacterium]